jgi:signal peptidase I
MPNLGRRWWLAALFAVAASGLGQIYNGQLRKAVVYFTAPIALSVLSWLSLFLGLGVVPYLVLLVAAYLVPLAGVLDAIVWARKQSAAYEPKSCNHLFVYIGVFAMASAAAPVTRASVFEPLRIPAGGMHPTIQVGDFLFVNKLAYGMRLPFIGSEVVQRRSLQRDDIVALTIPRDTIVRIERVVALAGDTVEVRNKKLLINGEAVPDPHAVFSDPNAHSGKPPDNFSPATVPSGKFFVMGDNRDVSYDSRSWGFADTDDVKGQATLIYWSEDPQSHSVRWDRIGVIPR